MAAKKPSTRNLAIPTRLYNRMMKIGDETYWIRLLDRFVRRFGR